MQKVLRRAQQAKQGAAKKSKDFQKGKEKAERRNYLDNVRRMQKSVAENIKTERRNRRIDWETGPLAPRRDVGEREETYGTVSVYDLHPPDKIPQDRLKWWSVDAGDRVVVTRGRDRGKIGTISEVHKNKGAVIIPDMNVADVSVPEWLRQEEGGNQAVVPNSNPIPVEHVKLVYPLPDPKTGVLRDVVVDKVVQYGASRHRLVPGSNIVIKAQPQPKEEDEDEETYEADTPTTSVDEETFAPPLLFPPMPMSVIDELRFKYSSFRTRHDYEYQEKKRLEDEREEARKGLGKTMRTPLQELAELRAQQKEAAKKELTNEQLAQIGAIMAEEKARLKIPPKRTSIPPPASSVEQIDKAV